MEKHLIAEIRPFAREPIIRKMGDGSLICTFLTGGVNEPENENYVAVSRSFDDGVTWTAPENLFDDDKRGVWATEIFNEGELPLMVVHTYNKVYHYKELQTYFSISTDNGRSWSKLQSFKGDINGCSLRQAIVLSNGDIMFPLYWQEEDFSFSSGAGILQKGTDEWRRYGYLQNPEFSFWEPNAIEVENGHIIMYLRNNAGYLYISESFDYGRSWTTPQKSNIIHSDTKVTVLKINDDIIMINNAVESGRTHLEVSKSKDGFNFTHICYLTEKEERFFYPHAFADDEKKMLYAAYENGIYHYLAKISYAELGL